MLNPALVLETALLMLAAFLIGATVGTLAKAVYLRLAPKSVPALVELPETAIDQPPEPALITAPMIDPLNKPAAPAAPSDVPVPDFASIVQSIAKGPDLAEIPALAPLSQASSAEEVAKVMAPARVAGQATSGRLVAAPRVRSAMDGQPRARLESAEVIPFPAEKAVEPVSPAETAGEKASDPPATGESRAVAGDEAEKPAVISGEPPNAEQSPPSIEVVAPPVAEPVVDEPEVVEAKEQADPEPRVDHDEAAAMRAIEGNWSPRRRTSRRKVAPSPAPDVADVDLATDSGVAAAESANGRPAGLPAARGGVKDNLTNIIGVLPIIETALNSVGVFHFDQVADFTDDNVAWLEGHLGISGRVAREHWREQARELAASEGARKVAGQS